MPTKHAKLSPSAAERWINCPPSVVLSEQFEDTRSPYAAEGTIAHSLAEIKLKDLHGGISKEAYEAEHERIKTHELYHPEMEQYTDEYAAAIYKTFKELEEDTGQLFTESRVHIDLDKDLKTFGTADCLILSPGTLHIYDFKYGKNVEVSAVDNPQLKLYALGALNDFDFIFGIKTIHLHIIQPRMNNFSDFTLTKEELIDWFNTTVKNAAADAARGDGEQKIGEWCLFCRAKAICRKQQQRYDILEEDDEKLLPPYITNEEVGKLITRLRGVAAYLKALEEYALHECLTGGFIPDYKAVEGRSNRTFTDQRKAFEVAQSEGGIDKAMLYEQKPISLTALEKLLGKKKFNEIVGDFVIKPEGKPTLVPSTDKRPAIGAGTAEEDFKDILV